MESSRRSGQARLIRGALVLLLAATLATSIPTGTALAALPDAEARMLDRVNGARSSNGLNSLSAHEGLTQTARNWAARMASDYEANGDRRTALRHNPSMHAQIPSSYRRAGENVGYTVLSGASHSTLVDRLHEAYMASAGHRANILGEFDRVGVGLVQAEDGTMWSAVVFMLEGHSAPEPETASEPEPEAATEAAAGAQEEPNAPRHDSEQAPEPEPAPPLPTTEQLFGADWPEGYLAGDVDAAKSLFGSFRALRATSVVLAGAGPVSPPTPPAALLSAR